MIYTTETRSFFLSPGVNCTVELPVPDLGVNPDQAPGLGKSHSEKSENLDKFLSEILFPQYTRALKRSHDCYMASDLPEKFLSGSNVTVMSLNVPVYGIYGFYQSNSDLIFIDTDTLALGCKAGPGEFIYGHELGHRILHKKNVLASESAISDVCSFLAISYRKLALELLCDAFGELVSSGSESDFNTLLNEKAVEGLKRIALKLAWSC